MSAVSRRLVRIATPVVITALAASMVLGSPAGAAQAPVGLGTATSFSVLAGSGITNTGATTVNGDIGSFPTPTITGAASITFTPPAVNHAGDAVTQGAKNDLQGAYDDAAGRLPNIAQDAELGGEILTEGVYQGGATGLTGDLTLDFQGSSTAQFVFKFTALTTAVNSRVLIANPSPGGNDACRVVWQISSSATFGTGTQFVGDALVHTSITATTGATFNGRLLALNGAVTLDTNTINIGTCATVPAAAATTTTTFLPTPVITTTSTTVRRTTTTRPPTTTTTVAPTTTTAVAAVAPTTSTTSTTVLPDVTGQGQELPPPIPATPTPSPVPPARPELPRTGSGIELLAVVGATFTLVGAAAVRVERRARIA